MEMMILGTANPQDFFEGAEPSELNETRVFSSDDSSALPFISRLLTGGYTVVITRRDDENKLFETVPVNL